MRIATWNINSVRLRIHHVLRFIKEQNIDVMCLQETKCPDEYFPENEFISLGMKYNFFRGEKSYNGVAILSKKRISDKNSFKLAGVDDTRHISVLIDEKVRLHNFYVPAGGDIPDVKLNDKFDHKIKFLREMTGIFKNDKDNNKIVVGDLNVAPHENDVWSHKQLLNVVSHTPIETNNLKKLIKLGELEDIIRKFIPVENKLYSWWSYRNKNWRLSDRGRRLDHILVSKQFEFLISEGKVCKDIRDWEKPSDHVPVLIKIDL